MRPLEERFAATVEALDRPDSDLVDAVLARIDELPPLAAEGRSHRPGSPPPRRRSLAVALVAVLVVLATVVLVAPARQAVAHWLGIGATRVVVEGGDGATVGSPAPSSSVPGSPIPGSSAPPPAAGSDLDGDVIPSLGPPGSIADGPGRARTFRWSAGPDLPPLGPGSVGAQLTVRPADSEIVTKRVDPAVEIVFVEIPGRSDPTLALWIGGEHEREAPGGAPELAQRVLVWVDEGIEYRLEADLDLVAVLALAAEIEPGTRLLPPG